MSGYTGGDAVGLEAMRRLAVDLGAVRDRVLSVERVLAGKAAAAGLDDLIVEDAGVRTDPGTVAQAQGFFTAGQVAGNYGMPGSGAMVAAGTNDFAVPYVGLLSSDHVIPGKSCYLRLRATLAVNTTAPTGSFTFKLNQITGLGGGAGAIFATAATVRLTSNTATTPTAVNIYQLSSPWTLFNTTNFPDATYYMICTTTATIAASSYLNLGCWLEKRYI